MKVLASVLLLVAACGAVDSANDDAAVAVDGGAPDAANPDGPSVPDAAAIDAAIPDAGVPGSWSFPSLVANFSTGTAVEPSLSANGLELFAVCPTANLGEICVATRASTSAPFGAAEPIAILNTANNELAPDITGDGLELFFERFPGIYVSKRPSLAAAWGSPSVALAGDTKARFPSISADGLTMYVAVSNCDPACLSKTTRATRNSPWGALEAVALPGGLVGYDTSDLSADGLQLLLYGGSTTQASILLLKRPSVSANWATVESIPNISFNRNNTHASWGFLDKEIYMDSKAMTSGPSQIYVSVLQ